MPTLNECFSIADLRKLTIKKLPSVMFDYLEGSAEDELTAEWNRNSFSKYEFVPRVLKDVSKIDLSATFQGVKIDLPIVTAPTGMTRMFHWEGEKAVVRATHKAGTAYILSTVATTSIEDVAKESKGPLFFQIYAWHDRKMVYDFIERCKKENYDGLMLAVDLASLGKRERDLRNGHGRPTVLRKNTALSALSKPTWLFNFLTKPKMRMANMVEHLPHGADALKVVDSVNQQFSASVTWEDAKELQKLWGGKFMLKGIQSVEDAILAAEMGATGIILSNHGGRQLDGAPTGLDLLPDVVKAVGPNIEVIVDGGIQRGSDVIKAIALGASSVLIGRAYLYGLAAGGEVGVTRTYDILRDEMTRVMQLIGCSSISELGPQHIKRHV
ncbi:MAG: alpha-hydroxy-acid oxidizing protein [Flavobacteriales bacterium]|jgi:L-lactate dehydrogenase (cytochrome)|nr:alpha-hydroxy-acid oxidizing protein [Flavobacteriales bacterium]